jgi:uncharacterized protein (DUF924 family)
MTVSTSITAVLNFWFGDPKSDETSYDDRRNLWFQKNPEVDRTIRDRFMDLYRQAASGALDDWQSSPHGCLALLLLLDQFPRNMFRGDRQSFATDAKALGIAQTAIAQNFDQSLTPEQRIFLYLPLEHSENLTVQNQSVRLFQELATEYPHLADTHDYALRHQAIIERFGRFPHRNAVLGRETLPNEAEFLKQPGSSF